MGSRSYATIGGGMSEHARDTPKTRWQDLDKPLYAQTIPALSSEHAARFWSQVDRSGGPDACWTWCRSCDTTGYGRFAADGRIHKAHRVASTDAIGLIPQGHEVKQTCGNRACVNPAHLRLVPPAESRARLAARHGDHTHCPQGHPYDAANTYHWNGMRRCRICQRERSRLGYHRRKATGALSGASPTHPS